jgi:hypothetical protein
MLNEPLAKIAAMYSGCVHVEVGLYINIFKKK